LRQKKAAAVDAEGKPLERNALLKLVDKVDTLVDEATTPAGPNLLRKKRWWAMVI